MADLVEENRLWKRGCWWVAGLDEAGRGALCGPVVAAALTIQFNNLTIKQLNIFNGLRDSKRLSFQKREYFYGLLRESPLVGWGIGWVGQRVIDRINILEATKLAMQRAVKNLTKKLRIKTKEPKNKRTKEQEGKMFLIIDGNFKIPLRDISQKAIIKADEKVFSCAAASILAKVTRDRAMLRYDKKYPQYGFAKHKGYPTKLHLEALKKYGPCPLHRTSFAPLQNLLICHGRISKYGYLYKWR